MNLLVDGRAGFVTAPIYPQESMDPEIEHNYYEKKKAYHKGSSNTKMVHASGKYDAKLCSNGNVSSTGIIRSGFNKSPNPKPTSSRKCKH